MHSLRYRLFAAGLVSVSAIGVFGASAPAAPEKDAPRASAAYPLDFCPVSGKKLFSMGDPVVYVHQGREIRFCCNGCVAPFEKDPAPFLSKVDAAIVKQQKPYYPLGTCVVTGEKLGPAEEVVDYVVTNRLVRLCCKGCVAKIAKDPAPYLAKLDKAVVEGQRPKYPLDSCVITGEKLGGMGTPVEYVFANRLVRLCCAGCIKEFSKNPAAAMSKLPLWTCAMHPEVVAAVPGDCPVCLMKLVPAKAEKSK